MDNLLNKKYGIKFNFSFQKINQYSLFNFLWIYFWKSKVGPLVSIICPFIFMTFYFTISNFNNFTWTFVESLPLYISLSILPLSLITLVSIIVELRNSILLRKIKTSGFSKLNFIISIFSLYFLMSIFFVSITFLIFFCFLFSKNDWKNVINKLSWGRIIYSIINIIIVSIFTGILLSSFLINLLIAQVLGFSFFILIMVLSGTFIPLEISSNVLAIRIFQSISPINNGINLLINSVRFTYDWTLSSIINTLKGNNQEAINSLILVFKELNIDPNLEYHEIINLINKGNDIFKPNYNFYFFFSLGNKAQEINKRPIDGIEILTSSQKWLSLILPYCYSYVFLFLSNKYFKWYAR